MAILVTGVGYIGSQLVKDLLATGAEVVGIDNFFSTDPRSIAQLREDPRFRLVRGNAGRAGILKQAFEAFPSIETVFCLAAQASAHPAAASPRYTENTNLLAPRLLLEAMVHYGARTIVFGSSFKVYGDDFPEVVTEETPYGRFGDLSHLSKCYVEKLLQMFAHQHELRAFAVRLGVVYGLGPVVKKDYRYMTVPNKFCLQAVRGEKITVYGSGLKPTGFIHLADASRVLQAVASSEAFEGYSAVNAVSQMMPVSTVAEIVANEGKRRGLDLEVETGAAQETTGPEVRSRLDIIGFKAERTMSDGITEMLDYFLGAS